MRGRSMKNFLAYDGVTVCPGPRLNLVVGPNGAGKSTIVGAICLALGGNTRVMDRGNPKDWVKSGQSVFEIEVDLNRPKPGKDVITFKRRVTKDGKSMFWIDGEQKTEKEVKKYVTDLDIQLDNLCHFLPQEKVAEFAALAGKPTEMLLKVEEAIGHDGMKKAHEQLNEMQANVAGKTKELDQLLERRQVCEAQKAEIEEEMKRFEVLQEKQKEAEFIEKVIPHRRFREAKVEYKQQEVRCAPLQAAVDEAKDRAKDLKKEEDKAKRALDSSKKDCDKFATELNNCQNKVKETRDTMLNMEGELDDLKQQQKDNSKYAKQKEDRKAKLEEEVQELKERKSKTGKEPADLNSRIEKANKNVQALGQKVSSKHAQVEGSKKELRDLESQKLQQQKDIREFRSMQRVKEEKLMTTNRKAYDAMKWLKENSDRFEKPVLGPLCIEISVKDRESATLVETALGRDKLVFLVQTDNDYSQLGRCSGAQERGHFLKDVTFIKYTGTHVLGEDLGNVSEATLKKYGITGTLISRVEAPAAIKSWLCTDKNWHKLAIANSMSAEKIGALAADQSLVYQVASGKKMHKFGQLMTPEHNVRITFSHYGKQNRSTQIQPIRPPYQPNIMPGDDSVLDVKKQDLRRMEASEEQMRRALEVLEREEQELRPAHTEAQHQLQTLKQEKASFDTKLADQMIQKKTKEITELARNIKQLEEKRPQIQRKIDQFHNQRMQHIIKLKLFADKGTELMLKIVISEVESTPLLEEFKKCREAARTAEELVNKKEEDLESEAKKLEALARKKARCRDQSRASTLTPEEKQRCAPGPEMFRATDRPWKEGGDESDETSLPENWETADEWEQKLDDVQTEISNIGVIADRADTLKDLEQELESLNRDIPELQEETKNHGQIVEERKKLWLDGTADQPGLRKMIEDIGTYFSETFAKLGNVGTVQLKEAKDEMQCDDFKNYGLEILVKFRADRPLQALDPMRQSGGEKSLTTMLFLLSLQQLTQCPFRVVDEINQGMDAHYERAIFERIVEWSSRDDTSQCFLITPKIQGGMLDNVGKHISVINIFKGSNMVMEGRL